MQLFCRWIFFFPDIEGIAVNVRKPGGSTLFLQAKGLKIEDTEDRFIYTVARHIMPCSMISMRKVDCQSGIEGNISLIGGSFTEECAEVPNGLEYRQGRVTLPPAQLLHSLWLSHVLGSSAWRRLFVTVNDYRSYLVT